MNAMMSICVSCFRQACGEMALDGLSSPNAGHQHIIPALPMAGAQVHEEPRAISAAKDTHCLQLQHGLLQFLHFQRGGRYKHKINC